MTKASRTGDETLTGRQDGRPHNRRLYRALATAAAALFPLAALPLGTVHPLPVVIIGLLAAVLGSVAVLRGRPLSHAGLAAFALLMAALLWSGLSLISVGPGAREALQPGYAPMLEPALSTAGVGRHPLAVWPRQALASLVFAVQLSLLVLGTASVATTWRSLRGGADVLTGTGLGLALLAILQWATGAKAAWWVMGPVADKAVPFGPFINSNHGAIAVAALLPIAVLSGDSGQSWRRVFGLVALVTMTLAIVMSGSRGALLCVAVAAVVLLLLLGTPRTRWITTGVTGLALLTTLVVGPRQTAEHLTSIVEPDRYERAHAFNDVFTGRTTIYRDAIGLVADAPLVGVGPAGFADALRTRKTNPRHATITHAHSEPLQALVEHGVVGAGLALAFLSAVAAVAARRWWRAPPGRRRRALACVMAASAALATGCLFDFPLRIGAIAVLAAVLCGYTLGYQPREGRRKRSSVDPRVRSGYALVLAGGLVALWATAVLATDDGVFGDPEQTLARGDAELKAGRPHDATLAYQRALAQRPLLDDAWLRLARARARKGDGDGALEALQEAATVAPSEPWAWLNLARLYRERGMETASRSAWRELLSLNVHGPGRIEAWMEEALSGPGDPADRMLDVVPRRADRQCDAARILQRLERPGAAEAMFQAAVRHHPGCRAVFAKALNRWGRPSEAWALVADAGGCIALREGAHALRAMGEAEQAVARYEQALASCGSNDRSLRRAMGAARLDAGQTDRAVRILQRLVDTDPADHAARRLLAMALLDEGRNEQATTHLIKLERAGALDRGSAATLERLRSGLPPR